MSDNPPAVTNTEPVEPHQHDESCQEAPTEFYRPFARPRRLRRNEAIRRLVRETRLCPNDLIQPIFVKAGKNIKHPIKSMPGCFQFSVDQLKTEVSEIVKLGIPAVIIFGIPAQKDDIGSEGFSEQGIVQTAIKVIKDIAPHLLVISDICCCEYTSHGHCGVIAENCFNEKDVDNDLTLEVLQKQAISHALAGADILAPSGMIDGAVGCMREVLDQEGYYEIPILSYSNKYASSFYGPFREAAEGKPQFGDRQSYQMDPANSAEGLREARIDLEEGADMLMVKPAMSYLDIVYRIKQAYPDVPLGAYQVSGEYAMIKAASAQGWIDEQKVMLESLLSIKRAGADFILSYFAKAAAELL